jgi:hypothetical protein
MDVMLLEFETTFYQASNTMLAGGRFYPFAILT